ncbi:MAG: hypothetical protein AAF202_00010 [Pseudomonadota bacterium]
MVSKWYLRAMMRRGVFVYSLLLFELLFTGVAASAIRPKDSGTAASASQRLQTVINKMDSIDRMGSDFYLVGPKVAVENCKSYPHYSIVRDENRDGHLRLIEDLKTALSQGLGCMLDPNNGFAIEHKLAAEKILLLFEDESIQKTFTCEPGIDKAVAYSNYENFNIDDAGFIFVKDLIPDFPGMLLDTNALAGNHKLYVERKITPLNRNELHPAFHEMADKAVFSRGLPKTQSVPYTATPMLLFHEMLHWANYKHGEFHLMDEVRLLQAACMGNNIYTNEVSAKTQAKAREILSDEAYWALPVQDRPRYAGQKNYHIAMFDIFEDTYSTGRRYSEETQVALPEEWIVKKYDQFTLYGPVAEVRLASEVLERLAKSPHDADRRTYEILSSGEHVLYTGTEPEREEGLATALFPSMIYNMHNMGVLSGAESNEDFQSSLSSNAYGFGKYLANRTEIDHSLPVMPGVDGWTAGYFFNSNDESRDFIEDTEGPTYTLEQRLAYEFWKFAQIIQSNSTQVPRQMPDGLYL